MAQRVGESSDRPVGKQPKCVKVNSGAAWTRLAALLLLGLMLVGLGTSPAWAGAVLTVNSTDDSDDSTCDSNHCSLREAIRYSTAGDIIEFDGTVFDPGGGPYTITLGGTELAIDHNLTITGPGSAVLTVSGNDASRVFNVGNFTVNITDLTIGHGAISSSQQGGGIKNSGGHLTVIDTTFSDNSASVGGAIGGFGSLSIQRCTFAGNTADAGGALYNLDVSNGDSFTVSNSTFRGNSALNGAAVLLSVVAAPSGTNTIANCTVAGNATDNTDSAAIQVEGGSLGLINDIVVDNDGGNFATGIDGSFTDLGHNLSDRADAALTAASDQLSVDWTTVLVNDGTAPTLADNGGSTQTIALKPTGPAVDGGDDAVLSAPYSLTTDQRGAGYDRKKFAAVDIGAFETQTESPSLVVDTTDNTVDNSDGLTSLREAIAYANSGSAGASPQITFDATVFAAVGGPYKISLGGGQVQISHTVTITGPGADVLTLDNHDDARIFYITNGIVAISGLTFTRGYAGGSGANGQGGAIYNHATLTLTDCALLANSGVAEGGAIANLSTLNLVRCLVTGNGAGTDGGGIYNENSCTLTNSTLALNTAVQNGGGLRDLGIGSVNSCTITGNTAFVADGGGIQSGGLTTLRNTIVAGNRAATTDADVNGALQSSGHNLIGTAGSVTAFTGSGDQTAVDWKTVLANDGANPTLADNGGATKTVALIAGTPAFDAGDDAVLSSPYSLSTDQRGTGYDRSKFAHVDIGAFEMQTEFPSLVVNTSDDTTDNTDQLTSLREAVAYANTLGGTPEITFDTTVFPPAGFANEIQLNNTQLAVTQSMKITGPGMNTLTITGNASHRVFLVSPNKTLQISDMRLAFGKVISGAGSGGAVSIGSGSGLVATRCTFLLNKCGLYGGAIYNDGGSLTLSECWFDLNEANDNTSQEGGAIASSGTLVAVGCTFTGNKSAADAGAIYNTGAASFTNCTFYNNQAQGLGGAIYNLTSGNDCSLDLVNCTIAGNSASDTLGGSGAGKAVFNRQGGGFTATASFLNTILLHNTGGNLDVINAAPVTDNGHNLADDNAGGFLPGASNQLNVDWTTVVVNDGTTPILADHGGSTQTIALNPSGPAVDGGDDAVLGAPYSLTTDQRGTGYDRKKLAHVDIGAYEMQYVPETPSLVVDLTTDTVNDTDNHTSLREAIAYAQLLGGTPVITFDNTVFTPGSLHTIAMGPSGFFIHHNLTITGPGTDVVALDATNLAIGSDYIFEIDSGTVNISGLTMTQGYNGVGVIGGDVTFTGCGITHFGSLGIYNIATLTLQQCDVSSNQAGGIYNSSTLTATDTTLAGNTGNFTGGALQNDGAATLTRCSINGNQAYMSGAGVAHYGTQMDLINCTIAGNTATGLNYFGTPAGGSGGGVLGNNSLTLTNCTVTGNTAQDFGGDPGHGGGVVGYAGTAPNLHNTIVTGNTASANADIEGGFTSGTYNLIGDAGGATGFTNGANHDMVGLDWKTVLANNGTSPTLANNGGPTQTVALKASGPARNAGDDAVLGAPYNLTTDQRGGTFRRKKGSHVDIGAVEMRNDAPTATPQSVSAFTGNPRTITLAGTDPNGDTLSFRLASRPAANVRLYNGSSTSSPLIGSGVTLPFKLAGNTITYLAPAGFSGADSFTFVADDGELRSAPATVSITVSGQVPPAVTIAHPTASQVVTGALPTIDGTVTDNSTGHAGINKVVVYLYRRNQADTGYEYWNGTAWTLYATSTAAAAGGAQRATTVAGSNWSVNAAAMPTGSQVSGAYYVSAQAVDNTGAMSTTVFVAFTVRTGAPTVTIGQPATGTYREQLIDAVNGTVTDNSIDHAGINKVVVYLYRRNQADTGYEYWNGSSWALFASSAAAAGGGAQRATTVTGSNWAVNANQLPGTLQRTGQYFVSAQGIDNHGVAGTSVYRAFTLQNGAPLVTISNFPAHVVVTDGDLPGIGGTVTDNSPDAFGIQRVVVYIYRSHTGGGYDYWNGTAWTSYASNAAAAAGGAARTTTITGSNWAVNDNQMPSGHQASGTYFVSAQAVDNHNVPGNTVYRTFTVHNGKPTVTISHPTANQNLGHDPLSVIDGTVTDNNPGHTGISRVVVELYRAHAGGGYEYWNGTIWTVYPSSAAAEAGGATIATNVTGSDWTCTGALPSPWEAGTYGLRVYAVDNGGTVGDPVFCTFTSGGSSAPASGGGLSTAAANAGSDTVSLTFSVALDADSAGNPLHYVVAVNGQPATVQGVGYNNGTVTLMLESLNVGDQITVSWSGLKDNRNRTLSGTVGPIVAK